MIDYKTFKKGYLNEWVDRSQAARKAAEELAKKDTTSLRDKYRIILTLNGKQVEFKGENEKNPDDPKYNFFTYNEAVERFGQPDKDGWRLPTYEELEALIDSYPYKFDKEGKQGIFDNRLYLPAAGYRYCNGNVYDVGFDSFYWSSTPEGSDYAWYLFFYSDSVHIYSDHRCCGQSVHLVRDVK